MAERKVVYRLTGCLVVVFLVFVLGLHNGVLSMDIAPATDASIGLRPDLILIDPIAEQKTLDLPAVQFLHDRHTQALENRAKDCFTCHKKDDHGKMSLLFMRLEDPSASELKAIYHDACIGCHSEGKAAGLEKFGPQVGECRKCHVQTPAYTPEHVQSGMNNALHYRHWSSKEIAVDQGKETNCGGCHHEYEATSKKLVYIQFQEEGCTACHTDTPQGDVKTDRVDAFHGQCVACHLTLKTAKVEKFGPTTCAGCHGGSMTSKTNAENKVLLEKLGGILPRLPRKQPDAMLLTLPAKPEGQQQTVARNGVMPVAFNHLLHEQKTESCADCHHRAMKPCVECHSLSGKAEGEFVPLEEAMHTSGSSRSCAGCHAQKQKEPACAGCHASMTGGSGLLPPASTCNACHLNDPQALPRTVDGALVLPDDKEILAEWAASLAARRPVKPTLLAMEDIPEVVKIGALADEYEPSEMPHRKIVLKMAESLDNNSLAAVFHQTPLSLCQGCHHNSPASATPPSCQSCHGKPFQETRLGRLGLKAAYHAQCMDCHKEMRLEKPSATDCTACHRKKENG